MTKFLVLPSAGWAASLLASLGLILSFWTGAAMAQSQSDFVKAFSGAWQVYDQAMSSGHGPCHIELSSAVVDGKTTASASNCADPLSATRSWSIQGSQLVLAGPDDKTIVKLGGNQKRITGSTDGGVPIILERVGGDGMAGTLEADYNASGCYYLGYSQKCASKPDLGKPAEAPSGQNKINVIVNLNAHAEPRADADTVGVVHQNTCVAVDACVTASDGPWCRAKFGQTTGWMRKFAIRQNRWPVVTFTNSCS